MRVKYVLNEVLIGLWRNATMTVAMIITMAVSLTLLGASTLMYMQVDEMKSAHYSDIEVTVFLDGDVTDTERETIGTAITAHPLVRDTIYESRADALRRFQKLWADSPDFVAAVGPDTLPEGYRVTLIDPEKYSLFTAEIAELPGIERIVDQRDTLEKIFGIFNSIRAMALVIAAVMAFAAVLLVANTIRVAAYSKRREVAVMKLVGASNWFVQAPFILESVAAGLIGAILGFAVLLAGKEILLDGRMQELTSVLTPVPDGNLWLMLPLLVGVSMLASAVAAWVTLRFHVKV